MRFILHNQDDFYILYETNSVEKLHYHVERQLNVKEYIIFNE